MGTAPTGVVSAITILKARAPFRRSSGSARSSAVLGAWLLASCAGHDALAFSTGEASEGCGCHSGGKQPTVLITPDLSKVDPGQLVNLKVSISATNGPAAGFYLEASVGKLSIIESGTKLAGAGVTHTATRRNTAAGSAIEFRVGWTAPSSPGGVDFSAWGNSVNGDGSPRGDAIGNGFFSTAFGCSGSKFYRDYDGDGVGNIDNGYSVACTLPQGYAALDGDCDENDARVHPGAPELCDGKDDNCDGRVDEGLPITTYCTDADGDGHGVLGQASKMGCGVSTGFGLCDGDCNDNEPAIYPGAPELCNNRDDNCNDRIDEDARLGCGVGWCARNSDTCSSTCRPGVPRAEQCNDFDDDCDGVNDNGTDLQLCGPGLACRAGYCVVASSGGGGGASGAATMAGGSNRGGSTSAAGMSAGSSAEPTLAAAGKSCGVGHLRACTPAAALGFLLGLGVIVRRRRSVQRRAQR